MPEYTWSDAWVLAAVAIAGGKRGAVLKDVLAAGDLVNRSVFTPQELRRGLGKLLHAGHLRREGNYFAVAGSAQAVAESVATLQPASYDLLQLFEQFLGAAPYPAGDPKAEDPAWALIEITDEKIARALDLYRKEAAAIQKEARE